MATKPPLFKTVLMQSQSIRPLGGEVVFFARDSCEAFPFSACIVAASRLRTRLEQIHHCKRTLLNLFVINLTMFSFNAGGKCFWAHADRRKTYVAEQGHQTRIASNI